MVDFQADGVGLAAVMNFVFDGLEQIPGVLFIGVKFAVSGEAEMPVAKNPRARKQVGQEMPDDLAEKNKVLPGVLAREPDDGRQDARGLDDGEMAEVFAVGFHLQLDDDVERFIEQLRKGMHRINGQGRQDGPHFGPIVILQPFEILGGELGGIEEAESVALEFRRQLFPPTAVLVVDHAADAFLDGAQSLGGSQAVDVPADDTALDLLFEAGDAHLEELVEIGAGDAEELEAFQERVAGIARLLQNALVEFKPAQFAIEEPRRLRRCLSRLHDGKTVTKTRPHGQTQNHPAIKPIHSLSSEHGKLGCIRGASDGAP